MSDHQDKVNTAIVQRLQTLISQGYTLGLWQGWMGSIKFSAIHPDRQNIYSEGKSLEQAVLYPERKE